MTSLIWLASGMIAGLCGLMIGQAMYRVGLFIISVAVEAIRPPKPINIGAAHCTTTPRRKKDQ